MILGPATAVASRAETEFNRPVMGPFLLWVVVAVNALGFLTMGFDKLAAIRGWRRVPEARLLLCAALTGAPGIWFGAGTFRHKTIKTSFRRKLVGVTCLNLVWPLAWYYA